MHFYDLGMYGKAVTLMIRYKDAAGKWRRSPTARGANGRVKPGHALVKTKVIQVRDGTYDLRHTVDRKTVHTPVGKKAVEADARRVRLENTKAVVAQAAKNPDVEVIEKTDRASLKKTAESYIKDAKRRKANEAAEQAQLVTAEFIDLMRKRKQLRTCPHF